MPTCGECLDPCSCAVTEDGVYGGLRSTVFGHDGPGFEAGRRNTVVTGGGFDSDNPYVLEFQHSEFYRPPTFEVRVTSPISVSNNIQFPIELENYEHNFVYETPEGGLLIPPEPSTSINEESIGIHFGKYNLVGSSVTFPPAASGFYQINIAASFHVGEEPAFMTIAAHKVNASAGSSRYLTCWGFAPSFFTNFIFTGVVNPFWVEVMQTTGATVNATNFKFWMTTV